MPSRSLFLLALTTMCAGCCGGGGQHCADATTTPVRPTEIADGAVEPSPRNEDPHAGAESLEIPFELSQSRTPTPAQQTLFDLYVSSFDEVEAVDLDGWGVGVEGVDQPWVPEVPWLVITGFTEGGHDDLPTRWIGIENGRYVHIVFGGEIDHEGTYVARTHHTCPWTTQLGTIASEDRLRRAGCRDHSEHLLTSLFARASRAGAESEALLFVRTM